ncbi:N-formylglutamate amidohydrolase [Balamuthia mandrillaris]
MRMGVAERGGTGFCKFLRFSAVVVVAVVVVLLAESACAKDGTITYGHRNFTTYVEGSLPVILLVPHGGWMQPEDIPDRTKGITEEDSNTQALAGYMVEAFVKRTGRHPWVVYSNLHRSKLDANRDKEEAAQGNPEAEKVWEEMHDHVLEVKRIMTERWGYGQLFDIHGQSNPLARTELGYAISNQALNSPDNELDSLSNVNGSSVRALATSINAPFSQLIRGPKSLGALLQAKGRAAIPSPEYPGPGDHFYFNGNWGIRHYGSSENGTINAIQAETHRTVRIGVDASVTKLFAQDFVDAAIEWFDEWYPTPLPKAEKKEEEDQSSTSRIVIYILSVIATLIALGFLAYLGSVFWRQRFGDTTKFTVVGRASAPLVEEMEVMDGGGEAGEGREGERYDDDDDKAEKGEGQDEAQIGYFQND